MLCNQEERRVKSYWYSTGIIESDRASPKDFMKFRLSKF